MTDLEALVVAAYVFADDYPVPPRCGRPALVADAELVALAVGQAAIGISSDRQFLGLMSRVLPGWFPHLPEQSHARQREGVRAARRPPDRHPGRSRARRQGLLGPRLQGAARSRRHDPAHPGQDTNRGQPRPRASARLDPARDRKRLLQPERADATRTTPRPNSRRPRRPHRPTHPRAHTRECSSTHSTDDPHAPSPPTTAGKSHQPSRGSAPSEDRLSEQGQQGRNRHHRKRPKRRGGSRFRDSNKPKPAETVAGIS